MTPNPQINKKLIILKNFSQSVLISNNHSSKLFCHPQVKICIFFFSPKIEAVCYFVIDLNVTQIKYLRRTLKLKKI